jgi:hypothetical protein
VTRRSHGIGIEIGSQLPEPAPENEKATIHIPLNIVYRKHYFITGGEF